MTHRPTRAKNRWQKSLGSKVETEAYGQTDRQTDGRIALPPVLTRSLGKA